jgi:type II secretory pathway component PulF
MIDPELKTHLETIEQELRDLRQTSTSLRASLVRGAIYGAGYVVGAVVIIIVLGWILNIVGVIPALANQVTEFRQALERIGVR